MPLGQGPGEPKQNPEAANWQRSGSMTESFLVSQPPTLVMYGCRRGEEIKKEAKSEDEDAPYRVIGMVTVHVTDSCSGHVLGVVVVSVCLSGAAVRGGRGGAACLSYRVCSSARPSARPPAGLGHAGCRRRGICLSLLPVVQP